MSSDLFAAGVPGIDAVVGIAGAAGRPTGGSHADAVLDFETLFVETLLRQAGLARVLDGSDEGGGVAGELFVREIARGLAHSVNLGLAPYIDGGKQP
jgi:hypothetical protein